MRVKIPSQFNPNKIYLEAEISVESSSIGVSGVFSSLSRVNDYYTKNIESEFNFSFFDENGFHCVIGNKNQPIKNLLVLLAYEHTFYHRKVNFEFSNDFLNHFIQDDSFNAQILSNTIKTLEQINLMQKNDCFLTEFSIWIYFKFQSILLENEINNSIVINFIDTVLFNKHFIETAKIIYQIDEDFLSSYSSKGIYQKLRNFLTSCTLEKSNNIVVLAAFRKNKFDNNSTWKEAARRDIAQKNSSLSEEVKIQLTDILNNDINDPEPKYLPIIEEKKPEQVAQQILKYYDFSLPRLDILANDLGTSLIQHNLGGNFLGLFVSNPNAHQSAIIIDTFLRNKGSHNFTIAHELGHYLLHNNQNFLCSDREIYFPSDNQIIEQQANAFSIELLMPIQKIRDDIKRKFSIENVREIADKCNVSMEAAARRRIQLDKNRQLAFISVVNNKIVSRAATQINENGKLWIGKTSTGLNSVSLEKAFELNNRKEKRLSSYLQAAVEDWLQDLEIQIYPFRNGMNGYYMFIERN